MGGLGDNNNGWPGGSNDGGGGGGGAWQSIRKKLGCKIDVNSFGAGVFVYILFNMYVCVSVCRAAVQCIQFIQMTFIAFYFSLAIQF